MNRAFLCGRIVRVRPWEVDTHSTCRNEGHSTFLSLAVVIGCALENVLLIRICFPFQLSQIYHLKALFHRPLKNSTVARNCDEGFRLRILVYPLKFPDDVSVLTLEIFAIVNRF